MSEKSDKLKQKFAEFARNNPILWIPLGIIIFIIFMALGLGSQLFEQF